MTLSIASFGATEFPVIMASTLARIEGKVVERQRQFCRRAHTYASYVRECRAQGCEAVNFSTWLQRELMWAEF